jgi:NTE family protein
MEATMPTDGLMDEALTTELVRTGTEPGDIVRRALPPARRGKPRKIPHELGQIVLVLQGGGALGAYQVGVYQALHEAGIEPDWVIGTSIGAINASLIAGNAPAERLSRLQEFWRRMQHDAWTDGLAAIPFVGAAVSNLMTVARGIPAFFRPNPAAFFGLSVPLGPEAAGYYDTAPLARTLGELVDFDTASSTGTAASCRTRRSRRCSTTCRAGTRSSSQSISGTRRGPSPTPSGRS